MLPSLVSQLGFSHAFLVLVLLLVPSHCFSGVVGVDIGGGRCSVLFSDHSNCSIVVAYY